MSPGGGDQIPIVPLEPHFDSNDYLREYLTVLQALATRLYPTVGI